jgi:hypothetical protein
VTLFRLGVVSFVALSFLFDVSLLACYVCCLLNERLPLVCLLPIALSFCDSLLKLLYA